MIKNVVQWKQRIPVKNRTPGRFFLDLCWGYLVPVSKTWMKKR